MLTISLIGQKGGAGKSTLARVLTSAMVADGHHVMLLDCDPNCSTIRFVERLKANDPVSAALVTAHLCRSTADIEARLDEAYETDRYAYCLIDTQGDLVGWVDDVIAMSDRVVIPLKVSRTDFDVQMQTYSRYQALREAVEDPADLAPICLVLNQIKPGIRYPKSLAGQFYEMAEHSAMLRVFLSDRNAYNTTDQGVLLGEWADRLRKANLPGTYVVDALVEAKALLAAIEEVQVNG